MQLEKIKNKIKPKNKEENQYYTNWLSFANPILKNQLEIMSNKEVVDNFSNELFFKNGEISAEVGIGSSKLNIFTIDRIFKAIEKFAKKKKWNKMLIGASNSDTYQLFKQSLFDLMDRKIMIYSFENPISLLSECSYTIKEREYSFGIYINSNNARTTIKLLGENGRLLKETELEKINEILKDIKYDFLYENEESKRKIRIIPESFRKKYKKLVEANLKGLELVNLSWENAILINTSSSLVYEILMEKYSQVQNILVYLSQQGTKEDSYDVSSPTSYREAYYIATKNKIKTIINIDGTGSKISIAIKHNKTWEYLSSDKLFTLLLNKMNNEKKLIKGDKVVLTIYSSPGLLEYLKKHKIETIVLEEPFATSRHLTSNATGDIYYQYSLMSNLIVPDAIVPLSLLLSYFSNVEEHVDLITILHQISDKTFFQRIYNTYKNKEDFEEDINYIKEEKMLGEKKVKSLKVIDKTKEKIILKITIDDGYLVLRYSLISNQLSIVFHTFSINEDDAFYARRSITKGFKSILKQDYKKQETVLSKRNLITTIGLFLMTLTALLLTFAYLFDWENINRAAIQISEKLNTPWPYILLSSVILNLFTRSIFIWLILKLIIGKEVKYRHLLMGTMLSSFVGAIAVSYIMGPAFLMYYLRKKKYHASDIAAALALQQIILPLIMMIFNAYYLVVGNIYLSSLDSVMIHGITREIVSYFSWAGWGWVSFNVFFYILIAYSKGIHDWIIFFVEKALFKFKKENEFKKVKEELEFNASKMRRSMKYVSSSPRNVTIIIAPALVAGIYAQFQASMAINIIADEPLNNYWQTMTIGTVSANASVFIPIPGKTGFIEYFSTVIYAQVVNSNLSNFGIDPNSPTYLLQVQDSASQIAFLDRINYYVRITVTGSIFLSWTIFQSFSNKNK